MGIALLFPCFFHFNPRPPRGERRSRARGIRIRNNFNPRPPRGERHDVAIVLVAHPKFQSTPPARGATLYARQHLRCCKISIHAPREGSDLNRCCFGFNGVVISIHAPREGSDANATKTTLEVGISIHAPREGSDTCTLRLLLRQSNFNPRPPRGERQQNNAKYILFAHFALIIMDY